MYGICIMCVPGVCGGQKGCSVLWNWSYRWALGIDPGSSAGAPSSINHRAISPALWPYFFFVVETFSTWGSLMWLVWLVKELQGSICLCGTGAGVPGRLFQVFNGVLGIQTQVLLLVQQTFHWLSPLLGHISRIPRDAHTLAIWSSAWPINRTLHIWKGRMGVSVAANFRTPVRFLFIWCSSWNKAQPGEMPKKVVIFHLREIWRGFVALCGRFLSPSSPIRIEDGKFAEKKFESWISDCKRTGGVMDPHSTLLKRKKK